MNLHYIIVPGLNLRKLNEILVIVKVFGCRRRNIHAVKVHFGGGRRKEEGKKERRIRRRRGMRARVTFLD
jgi:hypothetical protein